MPRSRNGRSKKWQDHGGQAPETDELREDVKPDNSTRLEAIREEAAEKPHLVFTNNAGFDLHYDFQGSIHHEYWATLFALLKSGYEISRGNKALILAAAWAHKDHDMACRLLTHKDQFGLVEMVKALNILDSGRKIREWEKKLHHLKLQGGKPKPRKLSECKQNIDNLKAIQPKVGSVSGALVRHIRSWVKQQSSEELEYYALLCPKGNLKKLADLCHLDPEKDIHMLPWFLPYCNWEPAPDSSLVHRCALINEENVNEVVRRTNVPYSHIKQHARVLSNVSKKRIAEYSEKFSTVLWNYEALACPGVDRVITERLAAGEEVDLTYGKLMERLDMLAKRAQEAEERTSFMDRLQKLASWVWRMGGPGGVPFMEPLMEEAEKRSKKICVPLKSPVAVLGDRTPSMYDRTSIIIASLLASVTQAKLSFFSRDNHEIADVPKTVKEVIKMGTEMKPQLGTAPAACLLPYYQRREVVKTFVVVTGEEENTTDSEGHQFAPLYEKYYNEVYPADLVFISFLNPVNKGKMVTQLEEIGMKYIQYRFNYWADLTKLDVLLALLQIETPEFKEQVEKIEQEFRSEEKLGPESEGCPQSAEEGHSLECDECET